MAAVGTSSIQQPQQLIPQIRRRRSHSVESDSSIECVGHTPASDESRARNNDARYLRLRNHRTSTRRRLNTQNPPEVIVIDDNDDYEVDVVHRAPRPPERQIQDGHYRSPPPPPADNYVPPLPFYPLALPRANNHPIQPLPVRLNAPPPGNHHRLPMLMQRMPSPGILPFVLEENNGPAPRAFPPAPRRDPSYPPPRPVHLHRNRAQAIPDAAPAPRVNLGGGLIGGGRGHHHVRNFVQEMHAPLADRIADAAVDRGRFLPLLRNTVLPMAGLFHQYWNDYVGAAEPAPVREETPDYDSEWTHPGKPEPGFSYSFVDESTTVIMDNGNTREEKPIRGICSGCGRLLITNGNDEDGTRIYALRCGHMIDAQCLRKIMSPDNGFPSVDKKGKGKARADYFESEEHEDASQGLSPSHYHLRSRASTATRGNSKSPRGRKGGRGGKRARKRGPVVTAQHYFKCPVSLCEKSHLVVQFDGALEWVQDKERGAVAIFV